MLFFILLVIFSFFSSPVHFWQHVPSSANSVVRSSASGQRSSGSSAFLTSSCRRTATTGRSTKSSPNSCGPRQLPCPTPRSRSMASDTAFPTRVFALLFVRKSLIRSTALFMNPNIVNFGLRISLSTRSKALDISVLKMLTTFPSDLPLETKVSTSRIAELHERWERYACWELEYRWASSMNLVIWLFIILSIVLLNAGNTFTGRYWPGSWRLPPLKSGHMIPVFQQLGNLRVLIEMLMTWRIGAARQSMNFFITRVCIPSVPSLEVFLSFLITLATSPVPTVRKENFFHLP